MWSLQFEQRLQRRIWSSSAAVNTPAWWSAMNSSDAHPEHEGVVAVDRHADPRIVEGADRMVLEPRHAAEQQVRRRAEIEGDGVVGSNPTSTVADPARLMPCSPHVQLQHLDRHQTSFGSPLANMSLEPHASVLAGAVEQLNLDGLDQASPERSSARQPPASRNGVSHCHSQDGLQWREAVGEPNRPPARPSPPIAPRPG